METQRFELKRAAVDRSHGLIVGLFALPLAIQVALLVFVLSADTGPVGWYLVLPLLMLAVLEMGLCFQWGAARSLEWPLWVDDRGLVFFTTGGRVEIPWEAVTGLGIGQALMTQQLTVALHPQAGPGAPGVVSTVPDRTWRVIHRRGLRLSLRLLRQPPTDVAAAIAQHSRGRWVPAAVAVA